jgi:A/G-specific adenine glycosylase
VPRHADIIIIEAVNDEAPHHYLPRTVGINGPEVVRRLAAWFEAHGRTFPWRREMHEARTRIDRGEFVNDPYVVLVSEVMLQQTQTTRVAEMLPRFLERFPTVGALASATRGDVLRAWQGLGYNSRAVRLHETAQEIARRGGRFPSDVDELRSLGGIGPYTAAAIACFALGADVPVVDVNIQRVLSRLFFKCHTVDTRMPEETIARVDRALIPTRGAYWWHQALMDHGATICTARRPACDRCPLAASCLSAFPRSIALYGSNAPIEPTIAGTPRRIWRGRIVEYLRRAHGPVELGVLITEVGGARTFTMHERTEMRALVDRLVRERLLAVESNEVREGETGEHVLVRLTT